MLEARFCPRCGHPLEVRPADDRPRPVCPSCGYVHYVNPVVAAGTLVEHEGRILLIRRGVDPGRGLWGLPAGYAEVGESPEETAARETEEETGLQVAIEDFVGVFPFSIEARPGGVLILYAAHITGGVARAGADATELRFFGPDEIPRDVAFRQHRHAIGKWARAKTIVCREAQPSERQAVARLSARWASDQTDREREPELERVPELTPRGLLVVALEADQVVGYLWAEPLTDEEDLSVQGIYVQPGYRRWGIGTRLLDTLATLSGERGAAQLLATVRIDNPGLLLLARTGFMPDRLVNDPSRVTARRLRLRRPVGAADRAGAS